MSFRLASRDLSPDHEPSAPTWDAPTPAPPMSPVTTSLTTTNHNGRTMAESIARDLADERRRHLELRAEHEALVDRHEAMICNRLTLEAEARTNRERFRARFDRLYRALCAKEGALGEVVANSEADLVEANDTLLRFEQDKASLHRQVERLRIALRRAQSAGAAIDQDEEDQVASVGQRLEAVVRDLSRKVDRCLSRIDSTRFNLPRIEAPQDAGSPIDTTRFLTSRLDTQQLEVMRLQETLQDPVPPIEAKAESPSARAGSVADLPFTTAPKSAPLPPAALPLPPRSAPLPPAALPLPPKSAPLPPPATPLPPPPPPMPPKSLLPTFVVMIPPRPPEKLREIAAASPEAPASHAPPPPSPTPFVAPAQKPTTKKLEKATPATKKFDKDKVAEVPTKSTADSFALASIAFAPGTADVVALPVDDAEPGTTTRRGPRTGRRATVGPATASFDIRTLGLQLVKKDGAPATAQAPGSTATVRRRAARAAAAEVTRSERDAETFAAFATMVATKGAAQARKHRRVLVAAAVFLTLIAVVFAVRRSRARGAATASASALIDSTDTLDLDARLLDRWSSATDRYADAVAHDTTTPVGERLSDLAVALEQGEPESKINEAAKHAALGAGLSFKSFVGLTRRLALADQRLTSARQLATDRRWREPEIIERALEACGPNVISRADLKFSLAHESEIQAVWGRIQSASIEARRKTAPQAENR